MAKNVWKCSVCGGENVQLKQWINLNTNEVNNSCEIETDEIETEDCWCQDCEEHTELDFILGVKV